MVAVTCFPRQCFTFQSDGVPFGKKLYYVENVRAHLTLICCAFSSLCKLNLNHCDVE
jgi:hypothetical protein